MRTLRKQSRNHWKDYIRLFGLVFYSSAIRINQIETHPFYQQIESAKYMKEHHVQLKSWGPLAEGRNNIFQNEVLVL